MDGRLHVFLPGKITRALSILPAQPSRLLRIGQGDKARRWWRTNNILHDKLMNPHDIH